ncbi:MAG TPA: DUF3883 domain-containing protein [Acidimicrobiales bacterium]|nr:DUF3883 domain-containing protein [Acidimicrobiales bacterium]
MAPLPPLWVYKCNANDHSPQISRGDWLEFYTKYDGGEWGGSTTMASHASLDILWNRMRPGDLVLAWQTDRRHAVGLCTVNRLDDWTDSDGEAQRDMILESHGEVFSPPVPLLDLRKTDHQLASVRCFRQGQVSTLYETSAGEARILLKACGLSSRKLSQAGSSPDSRAQMRRGAGFGDATENRRVEEAAVKAFKGHYRGWRVDDRQSDNVGYDFCVRRKADERHVEVKGVRGSQPSFLITENEVNVASRDPRWRICVVTNALSARPKIQEWTSRDFLSQFQRKPITTYLARLR